MTPTEGTTRADTGASRNEMANLPNKPVSANTDATPKDRSGGRFEPLVAPSTVLVPEALFIVADSGVGRPLHVGPAARPAAGSSISVSNSAR